MAFDVLLHEGSFVLEQPLAVLGPDLSEEIGAGRIEQEISLAIAIPVGDAQLATSAPAGDALGELQGLPLLVTERPAR